MDVYPFRCSADCTKLSSTKVFPLHFIEIAPIPTFSAFPVCILFSASIVFHIFATTFNTTKNIFVHFYFWRKRKKLFATCRAFLFYSGIMIVFTTSQRFLIFVVAFSWTKITACIRFFQSWSIHPKIRTTLFALSIDTLRCHHALLKLQQSSRLGLFS